MGFGLLRKALRAVDKNAVVVCSPFERYHSRVFTLGCVAVAVGTDAVEMALAIICSLRSRGNYQLFVWFLTVR